jgi:hypothetical protein
MWKMDAEQRLIERKEELFIGKELGWNWCCEMKTGVFTSR